MKRRRWVIREPEPAETVSAAAVSTILALGVGVVTFYLTRAFLAREPAAEGVDDGAVSGGTDVATR